MVGQLGLFGLLIILIGWIIETIEAIRKEESHLPLYFIVVYGMGSLFLAIQNFIDGGDIIFTGLMGATTILVIIQLIYVVGKGKKKSKK